MLRFSTACQLVFGVLGIWFIARALGDQNFLRATVWGMTAVVAIFSLGKYLNGDETPFVVLLLGVICIGLNVFLSARDNNIFNLKASGARAELVGKFVYIAAGVYGNQPAEVVRLADVGLRVCGTEGYRDSSYFVQGVQSALYLGPSSSLLVEGVMSAWNDGAEKLSCLDIVNKMVAINPDLAFLVKLYGEDLGGRK